MLRPMCKFNSLLTFHNFYIRRKMATDILVNIREGTVRGKELSATSFSRKKYYAFKGIPYAEPPVGNMRFRDPKPVSPWSGVQDATQEAPSCPQKHLLFKEVVGVEDNCLALNVFTPRLPPATGAGLPVMFWIHGGGFTFGNANTDLHDPDYWMEKDVVIVSCNYRVGVFGFLSLGTDEVPGNAGLKDQVLALRWVRDNISQFGGDPSSVTLFGESAGAASVHLHLLSPMSRGLFHRAILMSGSSLCSWAFCSDPVARAHTLAETFGCASNNPLDLLQALQGVPAFDLVRMQNKVITPQDKQDMRVFPFVPCVEPPGTEGVRFLTEHPRSLLQRGQVAPVPIIIGANDKEGMLILNDMPHTDQYFKVLEGNFSRVVPGDLALPLHAPKTICQFFFGNKPIGWETLSKYLDYFGDILFYIGIDEAIRLHLACNIAPVYCYNMSYDGQLSYLSFFIRQLYPHYNLKGVCHADDLGYIFKYNIPGPPQLTAGSPEEQMVSKMTSMWHQFASTGNPSIPGEERWEPAVGDQMNWRGYLELNQRLSMKRERLQADRMQFWDSLMQPLQPKL